MRRPSTPLCEMSHALPNRRMPLTGRTKHERSSRMWDLIERVFALASDIRYVAVYLDGQLRSSQRPGLTQASASESDKYEELIVNPTLLTLTRQRGEIDCGGLEFVLIRYGSFYELVLPLPGGHLSVGIEPHADPLRLIPQLRAAAGLVTFGSGAA